jgi:branched-chain amino acid transport system substrate-binding protein
MIFFPGFYEEAGLFIKQAREAGVMIPIVGGDGWGTGRITEVAGEEALNSTYYLDHCQLDDPALADFTAAYQREYNEAADSFSILGYDACKLMITAIEKAQSKDTEKIRQALESTADFQGISGNITWTPNS